LVLRLKFQFPKPQNQNFQKAPEGLTETYQPNNENLNNQPAQDAKTRFFGRFYNLKMVTALQRRLSLSSCVGWGNATNGKWKNLKRIS